jgi:hypothetical protein
MRRVVTSAIQVLVQYLAKRGSGEIKPVKNKNPSVVILAACIGDMLEKGIGRREKLFLSATLSSHRKYKLCPFGGWDEISPPFPHFPFWNSARGLCRSSWAYNSVELTNKHQRTLPNQQITHQGVRSPEQDNQETGQLKCELEGSGSFSGGGGRSVRALHGR